MTPAQQIAQAMQSLSVAAALVADANATIAWAQQNTGFDRHWSCNPRAVALAPFLYQAALRACAAAKQMTDAAQAVAGAPGACDAAKAHAQQAASITANLCWYDCGGAIQQGDTRGTITTVDSSGNAYPCLDMSYVSCVQNVVALAQQVTPHAQMAVVACIARVMPGAHLPRFPVERIPRAPVQGPRIGTAGDYWTGEGSQDSERRTFNCGWVHQMMGLGHGPCGHCGCPSCEGCDCEQTSPGFPCCGDQAPQGPTDERMRAAAGWWVTQGSNFAPCIERGGAPVVGWEGGGCYGVAGPWAQQQGVGAATAVGGTCAMNTDCASGVCQNGTCVAASHTGWWVAGGLAAAAVVGGVLYARGRR